jgi:hypothetical protein
MSRKSNFAQTTPIACSLFLLLSSTAWAAVVNVHVNVPVVHPGRKRQAECSERSSYDRGRHTNR